MFLANRKGRNTTDCHCHFSGWKTLFFPQLSSAVASGYSKQSGSHHGHWRKDSPIGKGAILVSKVPFDPMMRTRWAKEEQHRPCNQESTSKRKVCARYYRNKPKAALDLSSLLKTTLSSPSCGLPTLYIYLS